MAGNGTDYGAIVAMLQQVMATLAEHGRKIDGLTAAVTLLQADMIAIKADMIVVKNDIAIMKTDISGLKADMASVRQQLSDVHGAVIGHGIIVTEHDERLSRVEDHVGLPPARRSA